MCDASIQFASSLPYLPPLASQLLPRDSTRDCGKLSDNHAMVRCVCITIQYNAGRRYIKYVRSWCAAPGPHLAAGIDGDRQRVLGAPRHFRRHLRELRVARMRRLDVDPE